MRRSHQTTRKRGPCLYLEGPEITGGRSHKQQIEDTGCQWHLHQGPKSLLAESEETCRSGELLLPLHGRHGARDCGRALSGPSQAKY